MLRFLISSYVFTLILALSAFQIAEEAEDHLNRSSQLSFWRLLNPQSQGGPRNTGDLAFPTLHFPFICNAAPLFGM